MGRKSKTPNDQLRSLIVEAGVSHKGLARRVVDLGASRGISGLRYDHTSVLRWLAGEQPREPVPGLIADVFSSLLGRHVDVADLGMTPGDLTADLGLHLPTSWSECVTTATTLWRADVDRRRFLVDSTLAVSAASNVALRWLVSPPANPPVGRGTRGVGRSDVEAICEITRSYREMDNRLGGGRLRANVVHYLDTHVAPLLRTGRYTEETGRRLAAACAELAQLAGWMAYDTADHGLAQRYLTQALGFARQARDEALAGEILAAQAHQALYLARPDIAIDMARAAQLAARRANLPTLLSECYVMEAHGYAVRNEPHACARALAEAENTFHRAQPGHGPSWLGYFDEAYLAARMAHCFRDLGQGKLAEEYARRSLNMDPRYVRGQAFNLSLLATAYVQVGEVEQACVTGAQALDIATRLHSARCVHYLRDLRHRLRPYAKVAQVAEFREAVAARMPATAAGVAG